MLPLCWHLDYGKKHADNLQQWHFSGSVKGASHRELLRVFTHFRESSNKRPLTQRNGYNPFRYGWKSYKIYSFCWSHILVGSVSTNNTKSLSGDMCFESHFVVLSQFHAQVPVILHKLQKKYDYQFQTI